ncbi:hypothetical protein EDB92DRAFT_1794419 [Lactarius akahatsu]|uniref:Uncharacterized protein n=1 Tax=Lactarius akahatsu TaxID=416441 RepID=A0AAD4LP18_9AGAM|nr:hypothetical protein EDB92DRAFT_1794419 [Lactarius akahatsu]
MPSITDHINRLNQTTRIIKSAANDINQSSHAGPFSRSVLSTPLGDLIRDIDPSELGLFTLLPPPQPAAPHQNAQVSGIARVEVVSATPLRKYPAAQRRDVFTEPKKPPPEVFAEAALKYIDRYAEIRPMPHVRSRVVAMLEQLYQLHEEIRSLNDTLKDMEALAPTSDPLSSKSHVAKEEKKLRDVQARLELLQKRKLALQSRQHVASDPVKDNPPMPPNSALSNPQEDTFWTTPGDRSAMYFKGERLIDEDVDLSNVTSSFSTPAVPFKPSVARVVPSDAAVIEEEQSPTEGPEDSSALENTFDHTTAAHDNNTENVERADDRPLLQMTSEPSIPVMDLGQSDISSTDDRTPRAHSAKKIRVTGDVERIVSKIWATVGDLIMPGNPFSASGTSGTRPPRAKETIAHLHTLASQDPLPASPTASSLSSTVAPSTQSPTSQQVLTAHLLIALLEATPHFALPLAKVKELLSARESVGTMPRASNRVLYGCVAKRLIRIDRGKGEQTVRFDV